MGSSTVQVFTAVMHHGYRIVEDMIDGLSNYLDEKGFQSVSELVGRAIPGFSEWGELDLNYKIVAKIDADACIGCQLCYIACLDGAHQCIHTHKGACEAWHGPADHGVNPRDRIAAPERHGERSGLPAHVPRVDEAECIGCNLCMLVCPVPGCITMEERDGGPQESWNDRVAAGKV